MRLQTSGAPLFCEVRRAFGTIGAIRAFRTVTARQDGRQFEVELFDANGQETDDVFVDRKLALHFLHGRGRGVDGEQRLVSLAVLLDAVGEVPQPPVFDLGDVTTAFFDQVLDGVVKSFRLLRRNILPCEHGVFVKRHVYPLPLLRVAP